MIMKLEGTEKSAGAFRVASSITLAICLLVFFSITLPSGAHGQEENDQDNDGMDDVWETENGLNSSDPADADLDPDLDGLTNREEYENSTDPARNDTDSDGMTDGWEVLYGLDPLVNDAEVDKDRDGLPNLREFQIGTDPTDPLEPWPGVDDDEDDDTCEDEGANSVFCVGLFFILVVGIVVLLIGIGIYSKIRKDRLMDHETRQRIVDYLKDHPGAYYSQVRKDLDLAHGVMTHHLNMLEQQELIFSKQDRSYRRFYLDGMYTKGPIVVGKQKDVLDLIRRYPGLSQSEIGRRLEMGRMIVSYHINQLEELGMIWKQKHGRENFIFSKGGLTMKDGLMDATGNILGADQYDSSVSGRGEVET